MSEELDVAQILKSLRKINHVSATVFTDSEEEMHNMIEAEFTRRGSNLEEMEPRMRETIDMMEL